MWGIRTGRALFAAIGALPALAVQANDNAATGPALTAQEERQLAAGWYPLGVNDGWASVPTSTTCTPRHPRPSSTSGATSPRWT